VTPGEVKGTEAMTKYLTTKNAVILAIGLVAGAYLGKKGYLSFLPF
jgi:hypothetical protein